MDLRFTDEQVQLQSVAADFVASEAPSHVVWEWSDQNQSIPRRLFTMAGRNGWLGMTLATDFGGAGASMLDCAAVYEQLGRGPIAGPLFISGELAAGLIASLGASAQREEFLPALLSGDMVAAVALSDDGPRWGPDSIGVTAGRVGDAVVLRGTKRSVPDAAVADLIVCAVQLDGMPALALVDAKDPGVQLELNIGMLASCFDVTFDDVSVPANRVIMSQDGSLWDGMEQVAYRAMPILAAAMVGGCQRIFDLCVDYSGERVVFGQPIGRFQRVQDHIIDLANCLDSARWLTFRTLWKMDEGLPSAADRHEAIAVALDAYYDGCNYAHMVFAGPGTAVEHPLMAHTMCSRAFYQFLGNPLHHRRRMMDEMFPVS